MTAKQYLSQAIRIRLLIRQTKEHMKELVSWRDRRRRFGMIARSYSHPEAGTR